MSLIPILLVLVSQAVPSLPPRLTDAVARAREFPKGDVAKATALNEAGLAARKVGKPAISLYQAAVASAPAFEPARYNLACEQARSGDTAGAIKTLEALHRLGTRDSRKYLSLSRTDPDFESARTNPAYVALVAPFAVDWSKPILAQLCADYGRVGTLVDPSFAVHVMTEYKPQGKLSPPEEAERRAGEGGGLFGARCLVHRGQRRNHDWGRRRIQYAQARPSTGRTRRSSLFVWKRDSGLR